MLIQWTPSARQALAQIRSVRFTQEETKLYKIELVRRIEMKVAVMAESMPAQEPSWQGTYRILVDKFKVYYSFSLDKRICNIEALRHQNQQN
ncbi:hypothetical protein [Paenibacillus xylanexedens]|uniref:hypothetical protein n=1 Tax=Paenibacillus xylanexedens TaxID=528191 RepID=UPI0028F0599F|nr:hypothetical protein [Paenibacillus xylanexedens]